MAYIRQVTLPQEVITLDEAKNFLKIPPSVKTDDALIQSLISAGREQIEVFTGQAVAARKYVQALDSFPYYVDTIMSQQAYPPNYYSNPRYSTTLWNYSQMLKLFRGPLTSVDSIQYIDTNGEPQTLHQGVDFVVDYLGFDPRIFPLPGQFWPSVIYTPNAVLVNFTAGYDPDPTKTLHINTGAGSPPFQEPSYDIVIGVPQTLRIANLMYVAHWYSNREPVVAGQAGTLPMHLESMLWSFRIEDVSPTRG
jgi:hypothetical protein